MAFMKMLCLVIFVLYCLDIAESTNTTVSAIPTSPYAVDCLLRLVDEHFTDRLAELMASGSKIIEYEIKLKDYYEEVLERKGGSFYKWNHWIRTVDRRGRSLLMLEENYELLSLNSMKIGVQQINVTLYDEPNGCISALTANDTSHLIRTTLLNDFKVPPHPPVGITNHLAPEQHVCNMHVKDGEGYAVFIYTCCHYSEDSELICVDVERDLWMRGLVVFVLSIKVLIVLFGPLLIPEKMYRAKFTDAEYHYHIPTDQKKKRLCVVATRDPESYESDNKVVKLDRVQGMEFFKIMLNTMHLDKVYEMKLDDFRLSVSCHRLLQENNVPVGVFRYFYNNICRCKLRNASAFVKCCTSSICGSMNFGFKTIAWFKCLTPFMKTLQLCVLVVPWIIRIIIFTVYEHDQEVFKAEKAEQLGLKMHFNGSFTIYLTPLHGLFLTCYILLMFDAVIYGTLSHAVKEKLRMVSRTSLRDMREKSKINVCSWAIELALMPFTSFGFLGIVLAVPYWIFLTPCLLIMFFFYFIPTINFTIRMMIHFCIFLCPRSLAMKCRIVMARAKPMNSKMNFNKITNEENFQKRDDLSRKDIFLQYLIIFICIVSFWSVIFLLMECISFFIEMAIYTTIGVIINAQVAIKYISVISLFILYAKDCFGKLHKKYLTFHQLIVNHLLTNEKEAIENTARSDAEYQENTVFRVRCDGERDTDASLIVKGGEIKWKTTGLLVFLNHEDRPFFPEKLFNQMIEMKYHGCPGPLHLSVMRTFAEFGKIIMFLIFIVIVVMAFGDVYSISSTNQMIATGAGGLLPFAIRHFFAKKPARAFNVESIQFKSEFNRIVLKFQQNWPVYDIIPNKYQELHSQYSVATLADKDVFKDATDDVGGDTNNNDTERLATASRQSLLTDDGSVDLVVDVSNFSERYRAMMTTKALNGSLSMLAESFREPNSHRIDAQGFDMHVV